MLKLVLIGFTLTTPSLAFVSASHFSVSCVEGSKHVQDRARRDVSAETLDTVLVFSISVNLTDFSH